VKKSLANVIQARDSHCWHCGTDVDLVIHHRKNRGSGGSKLLDHPANLILVCQTYNFEMESRADVARSARVYKHKLRQTDSFAEPIFDRFLGMWFSLDNEGNKNATDTRET
jgi:5-methylcytosine-specific restriction endonuclease McrA